MKLIDKIEPHDIIAIVIIAGGLYLVASGINNLTGTLLTAVTFFYFGERVKEREKKTNKKDLDIEELIRMIAKEKGVDPDLAVRVAECESALNPEAVNTNKDGTRDRGLFQINEYWHPNISDKEAFDPIEATKFFCKRFKDGKLSDWNASQHCWDK